MNASSTELLGLIGDACEQNKEYHQQKADRYKSGLFGFVRFVKSYESEAGDDWWVADPGDVADCIIPFMQKRNPDWDWWSAALYDESYFDGPGETCDDWGEFKTEFLDTWPKVKERWGASLLKIAMEESDRLAFRPFDLESDPLYEDSAAYRTYLTVGAYLQQRAGEGPILLPVELLGTLFIDSGLIKKKTSPEAAKKKISRLKGIAERLGYLTETKSPSYAAKRAAEYRFHLEKGQLVERDVLAEMRVKLDLAG